MLNRTLIGLTGAARSGKDTVADYLCQEFGYKRLALADPIREICSIMFDMPVEDFEGSAGDRREMIDSYWGMSPRKMLQLMGTEAGRNVFGFDLWTKRAALDLTSQDNGIPYVVTDIRFDDEAKWVMSLGGQVWSIRRPVAPDSVGIAGHKSESGIDKNMVYNFIHNDGELDALYEKVNRLVGLTDLLRAKIIES